MHTRHSKRREGFTLIELLIVLVIIAILATISYSSYQSAVRKTKRAEGRAALMKAMQQEERYYTKNMRYVLFSRSSTDPDEKRFSWYSGEAPEKSAYEISAAACPGEDIRDCVKLTARPGTEYVDRRFADTECGDLSLTSTGVRSASGSVDGCWR